MKRLFTLTISLLITLVCSAVQVEIDGLWYEVIEKAKMAEVIKSQGSIYRGDIVIPEKVTYNGVEYPVTSIGEDAFYGCSSLTSITIPNSVTSIGSSAFFSCSNLTSITIPNSVTSIGSEAFQYCSRLTSITIPNSVTSIGSSAFSGCSSLTSITIPNSVTSIGGGAFRGCSSLTSITIPNSVKSIGWGAFQYCSSLTSITIPNLVTSIGLEAFSGCSSLTSITIPNSVTSIGYSAFSNCSSLTSVTIPNSVKSIGEKAFAQCKNLTDLYCYAEKVPSTKSDAFADSYIEYATLHVPASALDSYKATEPWSGFGTIKSLEGGDQPEEPEEPEVKICVTPTISYIDGKLVFACETEGAEFISEITCDDIRKHYEAEVPLTTTYTVTVRATKVGYDDSETTTATLCWIECTHEDVEGDDSDALTTIPAMRLLVQAQPGGVITLQGATATLPVAIFTTDGTQVASGTLEPDATLSLATGLSAGEVAIVKLGAKSVKVMVE